MFFSPVRHCIPDALPYVIICFIFHEIQPKKVVKVWRKPCKQHCQTFLNREYENTPYVSPELWVWVLQWVAVDTEGTGRYDVSGESSQRLLHFYCGTWQQSVLV